MTHALRVLLASAILLLPIAARGQDTTPPPEQPEGEGARPTGLPKFIEWTFNFDAGWGTFGFQNSLYQNPKEDVQENLSDQWFEGYAKPALSGVHSGDHGEFYGKFSAVGERTYGSAPALVGSDVNSFQVEDLNIGWRSGKTLEGLGENALDFVVGRAPYQLGHGMLVWDGASEGGSRGGYWSNARKAFQFAAIGRFKPGRNKAEVFYLDRDELPESDSGSRLWGVNYEFAFNEQSTVGGSYLRGISDPAGSKPWRDGMNLYNLRAFVAPIPSHPDLSLEGEWAREDNGDAIDSTGWYGQGAYELSKVAWKPKFSYRYAFFQGDDLNTPANEAFDPLFLGFYDWGTWWQGEIAGEYFLSNSNLISQEFRVHTAPNEKVGTGVIFWDFTLDQPASFAPGVTSSKVAFEVDWYLDWKINKNFITSFVASFANPGAAAQQGFGRTENFTYGMVYIGYSF